MQTLVVIPTYNEAENVGAMIAAVTGVSADHSVLVVDDASPDGTARLASEAAARSDGRVAVLRRERRLGLGSAYRDGLAQGLSLGRHGALFVMDCDFSHDPSAIPALAARLSDTPMVVGSRYVAGGRIEGWGPHRHLLSRLANACARALLRLPVRDCTSGFMGFRRDALLGLDLAAGTAEGYAAPIELKWLATLGGLAIAEAPIVFRDRERGRSKLDARHLADAARGVFRIWRASASAPVSAGRPTGPAGGTPPPSTPGHRPPP